MFLNKTLKRRQNKERELHTIDLTIIHHVVELYDTAKLISFLKETTHSYDD